jgi:actin-related protein
VAISSTLALYASGNTTGIVLECGDGVTHAAPIDEGYGLPHAVQRLNLSGRDLTEYFMLLLNNHGHGPFTTFSDRLQVNAMKEELLSLTPVAHRESYELPDGRVLALGKESLACAEGLFKPHHVELAHVESLYDRLRLLHIGREDRGSFLFGVPKDVLRLIQGHYLATQQRVDPMRCFSTLRRLQSGQCVPGVHEMVYNAGMKCDVDVRRDMFRKVVVAGYQCFLRTCLES